MVISSECISVLVSMYFDFSGESVVGKADVIRKSVLSVVSYILLSASFVVCSVEAASMGNLVKGYGVKFWIFLVETCKSGSLEELTGESCSDGLGS